MNLESQDTYEKQRQHQQRSYHYYGRGFVGPQHNHNSQRQVFPNSINQTAVPREAFGGQHNQSELTNLKKHVIELQNIMTGATGLCAQITTNEVELSDLDGKIEANKTMISDVQKEIALLKEMIHTAINVITPEETVDTESDQSDLAHLQQEIIELQHVMTDASGLHTQMTTRMVELTDLMTQIEMNTLMISDILNDVAALENAVKQITGTPDSVIQLVELAEVGTQTDMNTVMIAEIQQKMAMLQNVVCRARKGEN